MSEREHCPGPWVIPAGNDNGTVICEGDDPEKPGRILFVLREPWGTSERPNYEQLTAYGRRLVHAVNSHADMLAALTDVFALMDEGWLVRNTSEDDESSFAMRNLAFVRRLAKAHAAIAEGAALTSTHETK